MTTFHTASNIPGRTPTTMEEEVRTEESAANQPPTTLPGGVVNHDRTVRPSDTISPTPDPDSDITSDVELLVDEMMVAYPWLVDLGQDIYDLVVRLLIEDTPPELIAAEIRKTDQYAKRFPGINQRVQNGYDPITEAEYIDLEASYTSLFRNYGIKAFYNDAELKTNFATFVANDVSPSELSARLDKGYAAVAHSSVEMAAAFEQFYGVTPSDDALLLYFLDPDRGLTEIEDQIATAVVGSQALKYGLNITRTRAEILQRGGVDGQLAKSGFADTARELPQLKRLAEIHRLNPLSQTDIEEFFFHEDPEVGKERYRIFSTALNEFNEGGLARQSQEGGLLQFIDRNRTV